MGLFLIPDGRSVQLSARRSRLFLVDPVLVATNPAVPGWRPGRKYLLENTLNEYHPEPIRQVNIYTADQFTPVLPSGKTTLTLDFIRIQSFAITLVQPDGKVIVRRMPLVCFTPRVVSGFSPLVGETIWWQRFFDRDCLPDPRQSYIEVFNPAANFQTVAAVEFVYG